MGYTGIIERRYIGVQGYHTISLFRGCISYFQGPQSAKDSISLVSPSDLWGLGMQTEDLGLRV